LSVDFGRSAIMGRMARRVLAAALVTVLLVGVAACSGDESSPPGPDEPATDVALQVVSVKARGIDEETRTRLESEVGDVLASYVVEGFLGDHPRGDFVRALSDFSTGLADDGGRDLTTLTLAGTLEVTAVQAMRLKANLAFFNPDGDVVGASAFVDLDFDVTLEDGTTRQVSRTGRFALSRSAGVWQVMGYRICCADPAAVQAETTS
jgi:hypothetical protein